MRRASIITALSMLLLGLAASVASAEIVETITDANAPSGTHLQSGDIGCAVGDDGLSVTCSGFELSGVGNTNADILLTANYSGVVDCRNKGGNVVESHETTFSDSSPDTAESRKNGRMVVRAQSVGPDIDLAEPCPNPNWDPEFHAGSPTLDSFSYTLTFAGFTEPYIEITGP
jgi:hypothetical protein